MSKPTFQLSAIALSALCAVSAPSRAQPATASPTPPADATQKVEVTGSRLRVGDVTSKVTVITAEEIEARGVTSVEELIRTLPQNLATIGDVTNERGRGPLGQANASTSELGRLGISAANLGGLGAGNTLVLVNGRRLAGAAGIEDGFVNLAGIPLSAIERVEIIQGGTSAVYGADSAGGVINFILKRNFTGLTLSAKAEHSNNGANLRRASAAGGVAWGSGTLSGTVEATRRKPVINARTGYVTENYAGYYNGDPAYDTRSFTRGLQPGVIDQSTDFYDEATDTIGTLKQGLVPRAGLTGKPTVNDFVMVGSEALRDYVPRLAGSEVNSWSLSFDAEQRLGRGLKVFANGLFTRTRSEQERNYAEGLTLPLAPGQYYNPFPAYQFSEFNPATPVSYYPGAEMASGELPVGNLASVNRSWTLNLGVAWELNADTKVELLYTRSRNTASGNSQNLGSLVAFREDSSSPNGVQCYSPVLEAANLLKGVPRARYEAAVARQCEALTSSDPNVAFNPFKSSASGGGSSVANFLYSDGADQRGSTIQNGEVRINGAAFMLPAGRVYYALGGDYSEDSVDSPEVAVFTGAPVTRRRHAYFAEFNVPVFGGDYTLPGLRSLALNLAARSDSYDTAGAVGTVDNVPVSDGGQIRYGKNRFTNTTPAFGLEWKPVDELSFRAKWTRSFRAPPPSYLFNLIGTQQFGTQIANDPYYTCTTDCLRGRQLYAARLVAAPNPDLKPQTGLQSVYSLAWAPQQGRLSGLSLSATLTRTDIENEVANFNRLQRLLPRNELLTLGQFYVRDASGKIVEVRAMNFNVSRSLYESITYEASWLLPTAHWGSFEPRLTYVDNRKAESRAFDGGKAISTLGKLQGPDDYRINASLGWYFHDFTATLWANYVPSYLNDYEGVIAAGAVVNPQYVKRVSSYSTIDLTAGWRVNKQWRLTVAARNLFDRQPPFVVVDGRPYDTARYNIAGRTLALEASYSF